MNKVYSIILTALVALAFAPAVSAQTDPDYSIAGFIKGKYGTDATIVFHNDDVKLDTEKHFGYSKGISSPFDDGSYWIKLESFATGSAEQEVKPADVVLVLDFSGSMNSNYKTGEHYDVVLNGKNNAGYAYSNGFWTATEKTGQRFYKTDGDYYQVKRGDEPTGGTYVSGGIEREEFWQYLYFEKDGRTYYLDGMNVVTTMPKKYTNANSNAIIWSGALYEFKNFNTTDTNGKNTWTRLRELRSAVAEFIDILYRNDNEYGSTPLTNRISIVTYQSSSAAQLISGWVPVTNADGSRDETLLKALTAKTASGATPTDKGMAEAVNVLSQIPSTRDSKRTVVLLTDGLPGDANKWTDKACMPTATRCVRHAWDAKNTYGATVFSVSIYPGTYAANMTLFLECTSSNYPNAKPTAGSTSFAPTGERLPNDQAIYTKINPTSLTDLFAEIASMSGGSGANLTSASSTVDIISHSFKFPDNFDASQVKVFTAKLNHINNLGEANEEYVFDEEILAGHSLDKYKVYDPTTGAYLGEYFVDEHEGPDNHDDGLPAEIVTVQGEPGIKVTNFDYKNNWCGPVKDKDGNVSYFTGHKIIILIPIQMNPDAIGGPNVETNGDHSGVYLNNGQSYVEFKSPTVSLPVNIYIEKAGLVGVESAKFLIESAVLPDLQDGQDNYTTAQILALTDWTYVTSVYVTNSNNYPHDPDSGNPLVKVKGLPATKLVNGVQKGLVYRVSEEGWSWSYNKTGATYQYTITGQSNNPFTFTNTIKDDIDKTVKHAESKVTNVFKSGVTNEVYDDSKTNKRD